MSPDVSAVAPDLKLLFQAPGLQRRYGVILHLGTAEKPLKIHYEVLVTGSENPTGAGFQLLIRKEQIYLNDKAPDALVDRLADDLGKVLYPLLITVDAQGQFRHLANTAEIQTRWQEARPALARYYTGETAGRALTGMDRAVANSAFMSETLRHDWLLTLLCAPVYGAYQSHQAAAEMWLPIIAYKPPVRYALSLQAAAQHTESGLIRIGATGACTDARSAADILSGLPVPASGGPPATGGVALEYKLYPHNGTLFSVTGSCRLLLPDGTPKVVELEMYQLGRRDFIPKAGGAPSVLVEEAPPRQKKGGWRSFFQ